MYTFITSFTKLFLSPRKKVLLSFYNLGLGGIQTKIVDLANELSQDSNICVCIFLQEKTKFNRSQLLSQKVTVLYCPNIIPAIIKNRYHYLIVFLLIFLRPHSIFVSLEDTSLFVINQIKKFGLQTKVVVNIDTFFKSEQKNKSSTVKRIFNAADVVIAVSKATYTDLKKRVQVFDPPLRYIPNWTLNSVKRLSENKKDIIFLGRFEKQKRPWLVIDFVKLLKETGMNTHVHMYGSGSLKQELKRKIDTDELDEYLTLHETVYNSKQVIAKSKYMIITSEYEGLSLSMLEAMSLGTVILALTAPGVSEVIDDRNTGCISDTVINLFNSFVAVDTNDQLYLFIQANALSVQKTNYARDKMLLVAGILKGSKAQ